MHSAGVSVQPGRVKPSVVIQLSTKANPTVVSIPGATLPMIGFLERNILEYDIQQT